MAEAALGRALMSTAAVGTGRGTSRSRAPRRITQRQIQDIAVAALNGGPCVYKALNAALWDGPPPALWRDWPAEARQAWDAAVACYEGLREKDLEVAGKLTPHAVWAAIRRIVPVKYWPNTPGLRLVRLCQELGHPPAVVSYQMRLQGWHWGGRYSVRRIERAPCLGCWKTRPAKVFDPSTGLCDKCRKKR